MITLKSTHSKPYQEHVGNLKYSTWVTGVEGHRDSIYIKVNKHCVGQGLSLDWSINHSVLFNVRTGSLRKIPGSSIVTVIDCSIEYWPTEDMDENIK